MLTTLHKRLLNDFQRDFPLSERPFQTIADDLGISEDEVLAAYTELDEQNLISRIGAIIPPNQIGVSTLVAMAVPEDELASVADIVSGFAEVNHNYEREHEFNLWFVVIAKDGAHLNTVLTAIEQKTGHKTMKLPLLNEFFIDLGFELDLSHA